MMAGIKSGFGRVLAVAALFAGVAMPLAAEASSLEAQFDSVLGAAPRAPQPVSRAAVSATRFDAARAQVATRPAPAISRMASGDALAVQLASLATNSQGRIGVAALDLATGRAVGVLGDQPFPMASTSKIAIVATFLAGVDQGRWGLDNRYPLMVPLPSAKFSSAVAPVRPGAELTALDLIERAITRSDNHATDALLAVVGGPQAVTRWVHQNTGLTEFRLDRDIATLVRDDGAVNPAYTVDKRDSITPIAMTRLLAGIYQGQWLSPASRDVLLGAMSRCLTGRSRMKALLPEGAAIGHKTGTLFNTASDVGFIETPDGRKLAVAIYVTGQGGKPERNSRIALLARTIYDGYRADGTRQSALR
ncbi:serine hydrolase [Novosphingobium bradum]|uniref:Beta-lactamase n=1 Tax=Novosphingobium bradum TaxID=1737444 RepID=A0ABV7IJL9_9SPHN